MGSAVGVEKTLNRNSYIQVGLYNATHIYVGCQAWKYGLQLGNETLPERLFAD